MSKCTICAHPQRGEIEKAIVSGVPYRHIASQYGAGYKSINRHAKNHMQIVIAPPIEVPAPIDHTGELQRCIEEARAVLEDAKKSHDPKLVLLSIDRILKSLEGASRMAIEIGKQEEAPIRVVINCLVDEKAQT